MRRKRLAGIRYTFLIEFTALEKYYIDIWAKYLPTKQISPIANLNTILSEIKPEDDNRRLYDESTWIFDGKLEAEQIYGRIMDIFNDKDFLIYLEDKLDEDRLIGGWNSNYSF